MLTLDELHRIMPHAGARAGAFLAPLVDAMAEFEINTPQREAAFLAQVAHESGELRYTREIASGAAYEGRADLGNTKPEALRIAAEHGSTPGRWWKGHGPIQVTGYDNHLACGDALGIDLLNSPELLEVPAHGCRGAGWFWTVGAGLRLSRRALAHGIRPDCNLNDLADAGDFEGLTLAINGGMNGWSDRLAYFERAKEVLT